MTIPNIKFITLQVVTSILLIIQTVSTLATPEWTKSYSVEGWVNEVESVGDYVVSEYSGTLKYALGTDPSKPDQQWDISMETLYVPEEISSQNENYLEIQGIRKVQHGGSELIYAGTSNKAYLVSFSSTSLGQYVRTFTMESNIMFPDVLTIGVQKNYFPGNFWMSCDDLNLYRFSTSSETPISKLPHGLDMIKEIAINSQNYLASGVQRYAVLRSISTGDLLHKFTTANMMIDSDIHRINGINTIEMDLSQNPDNSKVLGLFALATDNSRVFIYDSKKMSSVGYKDYSDKDLLLDLVHIEGTEFLAINRYSTIDFLKFTDLSATLDVENVAMPGNYLAITRLIQEGNFLMVGTDEGSLHVLELSDQFLPFACETANRPVIGTCQSCRPGYVFDNGNCVPQCPAGQVKTVSNGCKSACESNEYLLIPGICASCDPSCKTCSFEGAFGCSSCDPGNSQHSQLTYDGQCVNQCPPSSYQESANTCGSCPNHCTTCSKAPVSGRIDNLKCLTCTNSTYTLSGANTNEARCVELCGKGEYLDASTNSCHYCEWGCDDCTGVHAGQCNSCGVGFYQHDKTCYTSCPSGFYALPGSYVCQRCGDDCEICQPHDGRCMSCKQGRYLHAQEGICVDQEFCEQPGMYVMGPGHCSRCGEGCLECSLEDGCIKCTTDYELQAGLCVHGSSAMAYLLMFLVILTSFTGTAAIYKCKIVKDKRLSNALQYYYDKLTSIPATQPVVGGANPNVAVAMPVNNTGAYQPQAPQNPMEVSEKVPEDEEIESQVSYRDEGEDEFDDVFGFEGDQIGDDNPYAKNE